MGAFGGRFRAPEALHFTMRFSTSQLRFVLGSHALLVLLLWFVVPMLLLCDWPHEGLLQPRDSWAG